MSRINLVKEPVYFMMKNSFCPIFALELPTYSFLINLGGTLADQLAEVFGAFSFGF